jgi:hypothetical protein
MLIETGRASEESDEAVIPALLGFDGISMAPLYNYLVEGVSTHLSHLREELLGIALASFVLSEALLSTYRSRPHVPASCSGDEIYLEVGYHVIP